ncbi:hypothetical protein [Azospirillum palustre]
MSQASSPAAAWLLSAVRPAARTSAVKRRAKPATGLCFGILLGLGNGRGLVVVAGFGWLYQSPRQTLGRQEGWWAARSGWRLLPPTVGRRLRRDASVLLQPEMHRFWPAGVAQRTNLTPQLHAILVACSHTRRQMRNEGVQGARPRSPQCAFRKTLRLHVLTDRSPRQAHRPGNAQQGLAGGMAASDLFIDSQPPLVACDARHSLGTRARKGSGASGCDGRHVNVDRRQLVKPTMNGEEPAFKHLARIGEQVPSVGNLHRLTGAVGGGTGVLGGAIPRHHGDARVVAQPASNGVGGSIGQQVENTTTFQVDQDGAIGPPLTQRPIIHADDAWRFNGRQGQCPDDT